VVSGYLVGQHKAREQKDSGYIFDSVAEDCVSEEGTFERRLERSAEQTLCVTDYQDQSLCSKNKLGVTDDQQGGQCDFTAVCLLPFSFLFFLFGMQMHSCKYSSHFSTLRTSIGSGFRLF
jgi:hypothetical protein